MECGVRDLFFWKRVVWCGVYLEGAHRTRLRSIVEFVGYLQYNSTNHVSIAIGSVRAHT